MFWDVFFAIPVQGRIEWVLFYSWEKENDSCQVITLNILSGEKMSKKKKKETKEVVEIDRIN